MKREAETHFKKTLQVVEVLERRKKNPAYMGVWDGMENMDKANAHLRLLGEERDKARTREEAKALQDLIDELNFDLKFNGYKPFDMDITTESERQRIGEVFMKEEKEYISRLVELDSTLLDLSIEFMKKANPLLNEMTELEALHRKLSNQSVSRSPYLRLPVRFPVSVARSERNTAIRQLSNSIGEVKSK